VTESKKSTCSEETVWFWISVSLNAGGAEMEMGWVHQWVELGWVGSHFPAHVMGWVALG